jgi:hypothetical protein
VISGNLTRRLAWLIVIAMVGVGCDMGSPEENSPVVLEARATAGQGDPSLSPAAVALTVLQAANAGDGQRVNSFLTPDYAAERAWEFRGSGGLGAWCSELSANHRIKLDQLEITRDKVDGDHAEIIVRGYRNEEYHGWGFVLVRKRGIWLIDG